MVPNVTVIDINVNGDRVTVGLNSFYIIHNSFYIIHYT